MSNEWPPETVNAGRYAIRQQIGRGGMGAVFEAEDRSLNRIVAVKLIDLTGLTPDVAQRFEQEAHTAAALTHPNIVTVHDYGVETMGTGSGARSVAYLVMERLPGPDLGTVVKQGPMRVDDALRYAAQAALGLQAAHERGVLHRDVKPANLMLDEHGGIKVLDFGIAKVASSSTRTQGVIGSLPYLAPERLSGAPAGVASDLYSLGVSLFELLTGRRPFEGSEEEVVGQIMNPAVAALPVSTFRPDVPREVDLAVADLLAKNADDRYPGTARDVARRLVRAGEVSAPPPGYPVVEGSAPVAAAPPPVQLAESHQPSPVRRRRWGLILMGLLAVAVVGIFAGIVISQKLSSSAAAPTPPQPSLSGNAPSTTPSHTPSDPPSPTPSELPSDTPGPTEPTSQPVFPPVDLAVGDAVENQECHRPGYGGNSWRTRAIRMAGADVGAGFSCSLSAMNAFGFVEFLIPNGASEFSAVVGQPDDVENTTATVRFEVIDVVNSTAIATKEVAFGSKAEVRAAVSGTPRVRLRVSVVSSVEPVTSSDETGAAWAQPRLQ